MVVCWWGEAGADTSGIVGREGAADRGDTRGRSGQQETLAGAEEGVAETASATPGVGLDNDGRSSGQAEGGGGRHKQQRWDREQAGCCREISFPPGFSSERVDLTPEFRFFREACCPDLDFVGQGLAASTAASVAAAPLPQRSQRGEGKGAPPSGGQNTNTGGADTDGGSSYATTAADGQRTGRTSRLPPPLPSPPGSTKCRLVLDMFEWLGAVSCGLDAAVTRGPSPPEPYVSEFATPRNLCFRRNRVVCRARLRGFLPPLAVARFVTAAGSAAAATAGEGGEPGGRLSSPSSGLSPPACHERDQRDHQQPDGSSWGSVTAWPFRDAPRAYPGADAPCAGGQRSKRGGRGRGGKGGGGTGNGGKGVAERSTKDWPVGGHGVYTVVACPGETAVAYVSARCSGPGW